MKPELTIIIPDRRGKFELDATILSVQKRLAFLETPVCRQIMTPEARLEEVKKTTITFKDLLMERELMSKLDDLYY
jgi:hypothetical protein